MLVQKSLPLLSKGSPLNLNPMLNISFCLSHQLCHSSGILPGKALIKKKKLLLCIPPELLGSTYLHLFLSIQQRLLGNIRCELGDLQLLCLWAHFAQPMGSPEGRTRVVCPFDQDYFPSFTLQGSVLWFPFSSLENQGVFFRCEDTVKNSIVPISLPF